MKENKMGIIPVPKLILSMAVPVILAMIIQALYNIVDSIYVSKISENALSALTLAFPIQMLVIAVFVGLGTGINSAISRKLGEKDEKTAKLIAEHGIIIGIILYIIVAIIGYILSLFIFRFFTNDQEIINYSSIYIRVIVLFSFGSILTQVGMSIMQGTGQMVKPMIAQLIGTVLNIILDPIFIFGKFGVPAMGVKGAAIATVLAQILSMIYIAFVIFKGKNIIRPSLKAFKFEMHIVKQIIIVGVPSFIMQGLAAVMLGGMNLILSDYGSSAIAVIGVYFRVQSLVFMPVFGLASGTMPVIGYNYGAKNKERIKKALKFSTSIAITFMTICFLAFQLIPERFIGLFESSKEMYEIGVPAFKTISIAFPLIAISIMLSTAFQGFGKAYISMIATIIRQLGILLPSAYILSKIGGLEAVWYSYLIAELVGGFFVIISFIKTYRQSILNWETE